MASVDPVQAWSSLLLDIARRSYGAYSLAPALYPVPINALWPRFVRVCVESASPWKALHECNLPLSTVPSDWPYISDISTGCPIPAADPRFDRYLLSPVIALHVCCPDCRLFTRFLVDSSHGDLQYTVDSLLCPSCHRPTWPFRSPLSQVVTLPTDVPEVPSSPCVDPFSDCPKIKDNPHHAC